MTNNLMEATPRPDDVAFQRVLVGDMAFDLCWAVSFFGAYMDRSGINGTNWADSDNGHTQAVRIEAITPGDF